MAGQTYKEQGTRGDAILFDIVLLIFFLVIALVSFGYNPRARSIPLALGIVGAVMTFLQLLVDTFPSVRSKIRFIGASGIWVDEKSFTSKEETQIESEAGVEGEQPPTLVGQQEKSTAMEWWSVFRIVLWLGGFILLLVLTNYLIAVAAFVLFMAKLEGGENWKRSVILSLCVVSGFFILFEVLLQAQL